MSLSTLNTLHPKELVGGHLNHRISLEKEVSALFLQISLCYWYEVPTAVWWSRGNDFLFIFL